MDQQTVHKTCNDNLKPTPEQEQAMVFVVRRCRALYNAGLQERKEAWEKRRLSVTEARHSVHLPASNEIRAEDRDRHSQVVQDALTRLDRAVQAVFPPHHAG